nr:MAG TPA: hypothetical protein [Caudoviricetes sp.]
MKTHSVPMTSNVSLSRFRIASITMPVIKA